MRQKGIHWSHHNDAQAVAVEAERFINDWLNKNPESSVVFPTGATPRPLYQRLRDNPNPAWDSMRLFHLDDYVPPELPSGEIDGAKANYQSFEQEIRQQLWDHIGGEKHGFASLTNDPKAYEASLLADGKPPGLIILGIGGNGHIAFNEPPCGPDAPTRQVTLQADTIRANFGVEPGTPGYPTHAATLGLNLILTAQHILLLATGERKRDIIRRAFDRNTSPEQDCPASWLKLHPDVTIMTDFVVFD